ncbi:MAG TPA: proteasome-type protease, partial [Pirellula sp.]|nr:proteasome-type protease [Pirellula sp.]
RIVKGEEHLTKSKLSFSSNGERRWWLVTSGLRSIRDKAVAYFEREIAEHTQASDRLLELANCFGQQLRHVRSEDGLSLSASNFSFNLHAIMGGQLSKDDSPKMYYIYPEGNWIESSEDSPYFIIGRTQYAKPILDRLLRHYTSLRHAAALAFLAFDATKASVTDVDFPIDVIVADSKSGKSHYRRFPEEELAHVSKWWHKTLYDALNHFPIECFDPIFERDLL